MNVQTYFDAALPIRKQNLQFTFEVQYHQTMYFLRPGVKHLFILRLYVYLGELTSPHQLLFVVGNEVLYSCELLP